MSTKHGLFMFVWGMKVISDKCWNPNLQREIKNQKMLPRNLTWNLKVTQFSCGKLFESNTSIFGFQPLIFPGRGVRNPPEAESLVCMPAPTRASHLDDMVFVLFFCVCCGVQYQCQCRMFYSSYIQHVYIMYLPYKMHVQSFFFSPLPSSSTTVSDKFLRDGDVTVFFGLSGTGKTTLCLDSSLENLPRNDPRFSGFGVNLLELTCPMIFFKSICILKVP